MCEYLRRDMIKSKIIRYKVVMAFVADKMTKTRLRLFVYMKTGYKVVSAKRCERLTITGIRKNTVWWKI